MVYRRLLWPGWRLRRLWKREDLTGYREGAARSEFLLGIIDGVVHHDARILELGCGAGRNLRALHETGYRDLSGVEINDIEIGLDCPIHRIPIEDFLADAPSNSYDLIFTMAVLEHLPRSSEWVFQDMMRVADGHLLTIEDEKTQTFMHYGRDYGSIFASLGMVELVKASHADLTARLFASP